ncbi:MAG: branched-chain amino acid ABC transporter permease [Abitibacteriaceae bacterium]|nr:branched-chain amino acid ABC transporter permease [Abditibacteriaceae bacterium]MBV9865093.1 branched-chain amino acid ABC transporter permease [Abditibacteriaceae bacterium]
MKASHPLAMWIGRLLIAGIGLGILQGLQMLLPHWLNPYYLDIINLAGINIILAVSLNLINGITGQFSLGHAGFMAVGAYSAACFTYYAGPRLILANGPVFAIALVIAAIAAGIAGLIVGLPSLRLRGDYLAIVTLGFGQIIVSLIRTINEIGGASGFSNLPQMSSFVWIYSGAILCILTVRNLADSNLGRSMRAVRDDEVAAEAMGINTTGIKVLAFVISSMWAGVAGALQVHYLQLAHPNDFTFVRSIEVVVMVVLGGLGSITGVTLSAVSLKILEEILRTLSGAFWVGLGVVALSMALSFSRYRSAMRASVVGWLLWLRWPVLATLAIFLLFHYGQSWLQQNISALRYVIYSLILIVLMLLRPQGLLGRSELSWNLLRRRQIASAKESSTGDPNTGDVSQGRAGSVAAHEPGEPADEGIEGTL